MATVSKVLPVPVSAFIASIGVDANLDFFDTPYVNAAAVAADLKYLGVSHVRDILPATDAASLAPYAGLVAEGVKFDLIAGIGGYGLPDMATAKAELDAFEARYPGSIASVEGPNEPNIYPFSYAGKAGVAAAVAYQSDLYKTVTTDPALKGVTVANFAFGGVGADIYAAAGDENAIANAGNIHVYPDGNGNGSPQPEIGNQQSLASVSTPGAPMIMTEFGYSTYAGADVTQATQAAFELDGLLDAAHDGLAQTYLYELIDAHTGTSGYEDNFGQFRSDATTPKAAAVALHNLTAILSDNGSARPGGTLGYSVSGLTGQGGNALLMQKSGGAFDLALWDEAPGTHDAVTVNLGATYAAVEVFDPTLGASAVNILHGVSSVQLDITGHPLVVQVEAGLAGPPTNPVVIGSGSDTLALKISEDAYQGDARFTISIDGHQIGGTQTATAAHGAGATSEFDVKRTFSPGQHSMSVKFLNDKYGGAPSKDRNLYVAGGSIDGTAVPGSGLTLMGNGAKSFTFLEPGAPTTPPVGAGLVLHLAEDAYQGDAQFTVAVDGHQLGSAQAVIALNSTGNSEAFSFKDMFGAGSHDVAVSFTNDLYGGTPGADRNLYIKGAEYGGTALSGAAGALYGDGTQHFSMLVV